MSKPKRYTAEHILPGLVDYIEKDQRTTVLVKKEVLDKMNPSFVGMPVFNFIHKIIDPETAFNFTDEDSEKLAVGVISGVGYNTESGYYTADMMIWDEDTQENIDNGFTVSCAYLPIDTAPGGKHNNVPYDEEVTGAEYHHMAIVEDPRYEGVKIYENSKTGGIMKFFVNNDKKKKVLQNQIDEDKKKEEEEKAKENAAEEVAVNGDSTVKDEEGNVYSLNELTENMRQVKKNMETEDKPTMNMEDTVDVDGEEYTVKEMIDNMKAKKNAEPPTDTPLEDVVKQNSIDAKENKEDPKNFRVIKNAVEQGEEHKRAPVLTSKQRIAGSTLRYSSKVKNGGKE